MNKMIGCASIAGILLSSGCASIVSKSEYPVTINSTPSGATVIIKNKSGLEVHKGVTPTTVTLPSGAGYFGKAKYSMEFQKEGYTPGSTQLEGSLDGWYFGNIIFGGLIGLLVVDPITGAMWKLNTVASTSLAEDPNALKTAQASPTTATGGAGSIIEMLQKLKQLRDEGVISAEEFEQKKKPLIQNL